MRSRRGDIAQAFGKVLRARRLSLGLSQEKLAFESDLTRNYIGLLELGQSSPTLETVFALAAAVRSEPSTLVLEVEREISRR